MSDLTTTRTVARELLRTLNGEPQPEWRTCFSTDGSEEPTGIAPVCPDEDHDPDDDSVYSCCPLPAIECDSYPMAAYLAALLNGDRQEKDTREGESTPRHERDRCMHGTSFNVECGGCDALGQLGGTV
ncbi:hypothetical protein QMZ92_13340 [Streptomyces sp. HNM0645]|uniref:hypothetical protein n=1 Tax=Streptomyces sp. HNM0645 TaxID=2782343 RepID=UPI0024B75F19|nr:hypothetical protein [Streptomyces sp. HNM0645]MDI9885352.1 hypothetical protein [Streptomyces sp. HNM0645]